MTHHNDRPDPLQDGVMMPAEYLPLRALDVKVMAHTKLNYSVTAPEAAAWDAAWKAANKTRPGTNNNGGSVGADGDGADGGGGGGGAAGGAGGDGGGGWSTFWESIWSVTPPTLQSKGVRAYDCVDVECVGVSVVNGECICPERV